MNQIMKAIPYADMYDESGRHQRMGRRGFDIPIPRDFNRDNGIWDERKHITPMEMFNRNRIAELAEEGR